MAWSVGVWPFSRFDDARFDPVVWRAHAQDLRPTNPRGPMVADLHRRYLSGGLTEATARVLLGEPDVESMPGIWRYYLGNWSGYCADRDTLVLRFDPPGTLAGTELTLR